MSTPSHSAASAGPYRWADFLALPDDDKRELVDGELLEIDVPTILHEWIVTMLVTRLNVWALERRAGVVIASGYKVKVSDRRGAMPDVQFYKAGRKIPMQALEQGAPDLAVEIISPTSGRYDRVKKLNWYASIRVPEYWIVDPEDQTLERLVLEGETYRVAGALSGDETFAPDSFPGLSIALAELWKLPDGASE